MKKSKICVAALMIMVLISVLSCAYAENDVSPFASDDVYSASVAISSNKVITYKLVAARDGTNITVNYCYLYEKHDDGQFYYRTSMKNALPPDCTTRMVESCSASEYITSSGTYRCKASFTAGNSTVTRTSNERTFD